MMDEHVFDLLPGYALGVLDDDDLLKVARHLPGCARCRAELATYAQAVDQLALSAPPRTPPPDLRAKVLRHISSSAEPAEAPGPAERAAVSQARAIGGGRGARQAVGAGQNDGANRVGEARAAERLGLLDWLGERLSPRLGWGLGALALILVLFLAVNNVLLWQRVNALQAEIPGGTARMVQLAGTQYAPAAKGYVLVFQGDNYGTLTVDNAPVLDANHQYQVWLIKDGKRTSGGVLDVSDNGYGVLEIVASQPLTQYQSFGITVEPKGGSPAPTGKKMLGGDL